MITFVMPTVGRPEFSRRLTANLNRQTLNYALVTEDSFDRTLPEYYAKVNRLINQVKTPYAMMVDNDDLVVFEGVKACMKWMHGDYVAAGGRIEGFRTWRNTPHGRITQVTRLYSPFDDAHPFDGNRSERIIKGFDNSWSFYAVHHTEVLRQIWKEVAELGISNLQLHEKFCAMRLLSLGKVMGLETTHYRRQYGTSGQLHNKNDFPMRLMTDNFSSDRDAILDRLDLPPADRERLVLLWAKWWDAWLNRNYGPMAAMRKWIKSYDYSRRNAQSRLDLDRNLHVGKA